jgi:lactoylglutathione lyase
LERPPILGVAHAAFRVANLEKARVFYGRLLGLAEQFQIPGDSGQVHLAAFKVNDRQYLEILPGLPPDQDERLSHVALETTDAETLRAFLGSRGVAVPAELDRFPDGNRSFSISDPDGHRLEFIEYLPNSLQRQARGKLLAASRISARLLHVGLTVRDAGAADRLYKDLLGFSEIWRGGPEGGPTSWINMKVPDGTDYLEYMLVQDTPDRKRLGSAHHAALTVPDIQEALETLKERPTGLDASVVTSPRIGRNNRWQLNLFDPDGTRIELMEPFTAR